MSTRADAVDRPSSGGAVPQDPILVAQGISVHFGGIRALSDVSIEIEPGSITGLIGPNGAGKSTLLGVLSGLQSPRSGKVVLQGRDVTSWPAHIRARNGLARTFQLPELFAGLTVRQHLALPFRLRFNRSRMWKDLLSGQGWRKQPAAERERVSELLEWLGLTRLEHAPVAALPLGYSRLVEVGRALAGSPKLVLLDEPLSGLDTTESEELAATLERLVEAEKVSFLLVDHDVDIVLSRSSRVFVLEFGRLIAQGPPEGIRESEAVRTAYLGNDRQVPITKSPG
jgi:branched-chain amino acid transport system ATP-binding protein